METEEDAQSRIDKLKYSIYSAQNEIKSNLYNYDKHVELISSLSNLYKCFKNEEIKSNVEGNLNKEQSLVTFKKLRNARKSMAALFPLSVDLWLDWIKDELQAPTVSFSHDIILDIFNKATEDYLSVDIWCEYTNYLIKIYESEESASCSITVEFIREIFEKAVIHCGLHFQHGNKIWEAFQIFEEKILIKIADKLKTQLNNESIENYKSCLLNFIKLFKRQMHIPLSKHGELLTRFTDFINPHLEILKIFAPDSELFKFEEINHVHDNTLSIIEAESILENENNLEKSQHSFDAFKSYIDSGINDLARVQCLFERAIVYHCLKPSIWLDYIDFLNNILKQPKLAIGVCERALRNVTWDSRIYIKYALIKEQLVPDLNEMRKFYEVGLEKYSGDGYNYCNVWISYISFEKRKWDNKMSIIKKKMRIYRLIQNAISHFEVLSEPDKFIIEFMIFWINIEKNWFLNENKKEIILKYFGIKYRKDYNLWYQIVSLAKMNGNINLVNDLFNIGLSEFPETFDQIGQNWLNFENVHGTLKNYITLENKISMHIPFRIQLQISKETLSLKSKTEHQLKLLLGWFRRADDYLFSLEDSDSKHETLEISYGIKSTIDESPINISQTSPNKYKDENVIEKSLERELNSSETESVSISSNIGSVKSNVEGKKRKFEDSEIELDTNNALIGPIMPPGFVKNNTESTSDDDDDSEDDLDSKLMPPPKKLKFVEKVQQKNKSQECSAEEHLRTVFVSNLHPATTESDLQIIFSRAGTVEKVDLHKLRGGKIFAYVIFSNPEEAQTAFELEHTPVRNRPVYVSKYNKQKNKEDHNLVTNYSQDQEKNKLFVSNLDKSITQNVLEKYFNEDGEMISLRLVTKKGSKKPFAYVEYENEKDATKYRNKVNNKLFKGRAMVVEFSHPGKANFDRQRQYLMGKIPNPNIQKRGDMVEAIKPSSDSNKPSKKISAATTTFSLIPRQAKHPRIQNTTTKKPAGPSVKINIPQSSTSNGNSLNQMETEHIKKETISKSNDDFRKLLLNSK